MPELADLTLLDVLDRDIQCYQTDDGTIFRFKTSNPQQLLMKEKDDFSSTLMSIFLPPGRIEQMTVSGDRLYFNTDEKKVYYVARDPLAVQYHRDVNWGEAITSAAISSFSSPLRPDKQAFHRLEDNNTNKIFTNSSEMAQGGIVVAIHRSKVVFANTGRTVDVHILAMGPNAIVLSLPHATGNIYCHDSSPFIYAPAKESLIVLNTDTMKPQDTLKASGLSNISIVGVRGEEITFAADQDGERFLMMARLPEGYFEQQRIEPPPSWIRDRTNEFLRIAEQFEKEQKPNTSQLDDIQFPRNNDFFKAFNAKMMPTGNNDTCKASNAKTVPTRNDVRMPWEMESKMNDTVNELLDKNAALEKQLEKEKGVSQNNEQDEMLKSFRESNEKLIKDNAHLEVNNKESMQTLARATAINEEVTAANDQLNEELVIMYEEEEQETLKELRTKYGAFTEEKRKMISAALEKKKNMIELLKEMISENKKLCNSLSARSNSGRIVDSVGARKLIAENEEILKSTAMRKL